MGSDRFNRRYQAGKSRVARPTFPRNRLLKVGHATLQLKPTQAQRAEPLTGTGNGQYHLWDVLITTQDANAERNLSNGIDP